MKQFININDTHGKNVKHCINVSHIVRVVSSSTEDWNGCCIVMVDGGAKVWAVESYETVLKLIAKASK